MSEATAPEWLYNWRDISQYPDPEQAPPNQWQWEFVRRNTGYQEDFKRAKPETYRAIKERYCVPFPLFDPSDSRYKIVVDLDDGSTDLRVFRIVEARVITGNVLSIRKFLNGENPNKEQHERMFADPKRYQVLIIDNMKPLEEQMRCMLKMMEFTQKGYLKDKRKQGTPQEYLRYLRTYDALLSGANEKDVAVELHGKDPASDDIGAIIDDVRKDNERAQELINGGYLLINPDFLI